MNGKVCVSQMAMGIIWTAMVFLSVLYAMANSTMDAVTAGALDGAAAAVQLCIAMTGAICLWSGILEVMRRSGLATLLERLLRPILRFLYPSFARDKDVLGNIAANVSANLLGLGNAATAPGIRAAQLMSSKSPGIASNELCMLVVCNTASIQLLPTTAASLRAAAGCTTPFDILPAVWLASALSVSVGIFAAKILERVWPA